MMTELVELLISPPFFVELLVKFKCFIGDAAAVEGEEEDGGDGGDDDAGDGDGDEDDAFPQHPCSPQSQKNDEYLSSLRSCPKWQVLAQFMHTPRLSQSPHV